MKNVLKSLALVAVSALAAVSCQKNEVVGNGNEGDIFFTLNTGDTRTYMVADGNSYQPMWAKGDEIGVLFEGFAKDRTSPQGKLTNSNENGQTASFEGTITAENDGTLYAFYPAKFAKTYEGQTVGFDIPANQKPTATSFDPAADLLISKPVSYNAVGGSVSIDDVFFARALSILKINVYSSDFEAIQGQFLGKLTVTASDTLLSGRPVFDLTKGDAMITKYNTQNKSVGALYDADVVSVGSSKTATGCSVFLMVAPGTHKGGATLKFEGETLGYTFSKEVTLPKDMVLNPGKLTEINLSLAESNCEVKVAETRIWVENFANVTVKEEQYQPDETGATGTGVVDATKYDYGTDEKTNIRFNSNGHTSSDPYLYLRGSSTFTVSNITVSEQSDLILSAQTKNAGTVTLKCKESTAEEWTEIGSWTSTGSFSEQKTIFNIAGTATSIDLSFTASASIIIDDIVLEKFVDQRTTLAVPANVKAEADATTSNKVNVTWGAVENAGSYEVTLSTAGEEDVVENAETNSISFTGLKYSTQYSVKVKAVSSDVSLYKDSEYSTAAGVTTGAEPAVMIDWVKKAVGDILPTDEVVLVGGNANSLKSTATSSNPTLVTVTVSNGKLTSEVTDDMKWNLVGDITNGFILYANGTTERYLYCNTTAASKSNTCIRVGKQSSNIRNLWTIDNNGYMITKDSYTKRYLSVYADGPDWRGYTNTDNGAQKVEFYVKNDPRTALATPEITVTPDNAAKKITVSWDVVANAKDYTVTCGQTEKNVTETSCEFTGLEYGEYTVTVQANPADETSYKPSAKASKDVSIVDTTPVINAENPTAVEATATSVEVPYTVTNEVAGTNLTAAVTTGDWISNPQVAADKVTFTLSANTTSEQRTGTVTLSYAGAADKVITITQKGAGQAGYASLEELVAAGEPTSDGTTVTVTFSNKKIIDIYISGKYRNGIYLPVAGAPNNKIEIFCHDVPTDWVVGGWVSATLTCKWMKYNDNTWELCPSNWNDINYVGPVAKPEITLDGANATITCATAGATILYEIADTEPASFTHTYSGPVALTDGQTIWAKATLAGHPDSEVASKKYTAGGGTHEESFTITSDAVVTNSGYAKYETTVDNRGWIITFGGNNKSVGTNSGNRSKCTLSSYSKYAVSPVTTSDIASAYASTTKLTGVKKISYTFNGGSNQTDTNVYLIYSSDGNTFSQISLTSGTQGATISSGTTYEFTPCDGYFALLFKATNASGNWRIDNVNITFTYDVTD